MFKRPLQVFLQAAAEDELDVLQRFVAEQPIQFRTLKHIPGIFILYGDAVDGDNCGVVIAVFILCIPVIIVYALFGWMAGADETDLSEPIAHTIREEIPQEAILEFEAQWYTEINN